MWRIIATHTREGREIARKEIDVGEVTIGRDADRGLVLQSASVSRRHCKIRVDHTGATIMDEGSANGVLVNGVRVAPNSPTPIGPGVNVEIAEFRITIEPLMMQQPMMGMPGMAPMQQPMMGMPGMGQMPMGQMPGMMGPAMSGGMPGMMPMSGAPMGGMPMGGPPAPSVDLVRLIAEGGQFNGRIFDLPPVAEMTVGRGVGNDLVLDDQSMSRKHSKIKRLGGGRIEVEDLNSSNGTYVNGRKIASAQCGPGDTVRFGELSFRIDGAGGGGGRAGQGVESGGGVAAAPPWAKPVFFALAGATVLIWLLWIVKLIAPGGASKAEVEKALKQKETEASEKIASAKEALDKSDFAKAKDLAEQGLETDPANLDGIRIRAQASRAIDDESKHRQGITELEKNNPDGFTAALRIYDSMSLDSKKRSDLGSALRNKLIPGGEEFCRKKLFRECFDALCAAGRLGGEKLSPNAVKLLKDAEKRAKVPAPCPHVK